MDYPCSYYSYMKTVGYEKSMLTVQKRQREKWLS